MMYDKQKIMDTFSENLKYQLDKNNKRPVDLAAELGVSETSTSDWLKAKKIPRIDKINHIADWLHCSLTDLLEPRDIDSDNERFRACVYQEYGALFDLSEKLTDEQKKQVTDYIRFLVSQNPNSD